MSAGNLTQAEADLLIEVEKRCSTQTEYEYPMFGGALKIPLMSPDLPETFHLDINKSKIELTKVTYQNRVKVHLVLLRLDLGGPPHRNPDGEEFPCPHLHVYREGYGAKWAYPLPDHFTDAGDLRLALREFMQYCNITVVPRIRFGLFP